MGKYDIVDENDNVTGKTASNKEFVTPEHHRRSIHIFLLNSKGELLIGKRPSFKKRFPNLWTAGAGGKVDAGESYFDAAKRELKEELGVEVELEEVTKAPFKNEIYGYISFHIIYSGRSEGPFDPDPEEIDKLKWISLEDLEKDIKDNPNNYSLAFQSTFKAYLEASK